MQSPVVCSCCKRTYAYKDGDGSPTHGLACPECKKDPEKIARLYGTSVERIKEVLSGKDR